MTVLCYISTMKQAITWKVRNETMEKQIIEFAVMTENNVASKVGIAVVTQPKQQFKGGNIKWLPEQVKQEYRNKKW